MQWARASAASRPRNASRKQLAVLVSGAGLRRHRLDHREDVLHPVAQLVDQQLAFHLRVLAVADVDAVLDHGAGIELPAGEHHPRARAVLEDVLLLVGADPSGPLQLLHFLFAEGDPFRRRHPPPGQLPGVHLVARVAGHAQEDVVGVHDSAGGIEEHHPDGVGLQDPAETVLARAARLLPPGALGDVLDGEQDELQMIDPAGVEQHHPAADLLEPVLDDEAVEAVVVREHGLQELAQPGDVPLAVAEFVDEAPPGVVGVHGELRIEGLVGGIHPQVPAENQQGVARGVEDLLGQLLLPFEIEAKALRLGCVLEAEQKVAAAIGELRRAGPRQQDPPAEAVEAVLDAEFTAFALGAQSALEQLLQRADGPAAVRDLEQLAAFVALGLGLERPAKRRVGDLDRQVFGKHQEWLANRSGDGPGVPVHRRLTSVRLGVIEPIPLKQAAVGQPRERPEHSTIRPQRYADAGRRSTKAT
ncbi:MAG: hypothetical protein U0S49_00590 [Rhodospirillales bacterium]|nr:hypothetical protein [Rhodospirillales bacterium]